MTSPPSPGSDPALAELVARARSRVAGIAPQGLDRWLLVDVAGQRLALVHDGTVAEIWPVSTAERGLDSREGSHGTPPGLHAIERRIGLDQPLGAVFESRRPTGEIWSAGSGATDADLILTRVLTLVGLEDGINRGPGLDSRERYIYIHGTNHEDSLGRPRSHGCIRMANEQVRELCDRIAEGDPVVIV